jgi:hypothetical protein
MGTTQALTDTSTATRKGKCVTGISMDTGVKMQDTMVRGSCIQSTGVISIITPMNTIGILVHPGRFTYTDKL